MKFLSKLIIIAAILFSGFAKAQPIPKWKLADLEQAIAKADKPTIFNFWATFCAPCLEEIPHFQKLVKQYEKEGVQLILVNLDAEETYKKLPAFTKRFSITAPVRFLDETNADAFCPVVDAKWSGAIPASLFVNNKKGYRAFFEDQLSAVQFEKELKELIK